MSDAVLLCDLDAAAAARSLRSLRCGDRCCSAAPGKFFDRDGDGVVSPDDFFNGLSVMQSRDGDFLKLIFQASQLSPSKGARCQAAR
jgi:hypothetical protein